MFLRRAFLNSFPLSAYGFFLRGNNETNKYSFEADISVSGTSLSAITNFNAFYANNMIGNLLYAVNIFGSVNDVATNNKSYKYFFSSESWAEGSALNIGNRAFSITHGNSTKGYFIGGINYVIDTSTNLTTSSICTFSSGVFTAGAFVSKENYRAAALGVEQTGYIFGGFTSAFASTATGYKYQYTLNTQVTTTSLPSAKNDGVGVNNPIYGIVSAGRVGVTDSLVSFKFVFSSEVMSTGTNLTINGPGLSTAGNKEIGVFAGGYGKIGGLKNTSIYKYSSEVTTNGSFLAVGTSDSAGVSSAPGGW